MEIPNNAWCNTNKMFLCKQMVKKNVLMGVIKRRTNPL